MAVVTERKVKLAETTAVRAYLDVCSRPARRGRPVTTEHLQKRLEAVEAELVDARGLDKVLLFQKTFDLQAQLLALPEPEDLVKIEAGFVEHAFAWALRRGVSYAALRLGGVPAKVLKEAGF